MPYSKSRRPNCAKCGKALSSLRCRLCAPCSHATRQAAATDKTPASESRLCSCGAVIECGLTGWQRYFCSQECRSEPVWKVAAVLTRTRTAAIRKGVIQQ